MEGVLHFAEGPLFRLAFAVMLFGLLRHVVILGIGMGQALGRSADPVPPFQSRFSKLTKITLKWLRPFTHLHIRPVYSLISLAFHFGVILVPLFLLAHVELWRAGFGFGWITLPQKIADVLTLLVVVTSLALFVMRVADRNTRFLSRPQDYWIPLLLAVPFLSGFLSIHAMTYPLPYTLMRLIHVLSGELVMVLMPFTKLIHCVFYPLVHYASNYAWRLAPDAGEHVWKTLGKEGRV